MNKFNVAFPYSDFIFLQKILRLRWFIARTLYNSFRSVVTRRNPITVEVPWPMAERVVTMSEKHTKNNHTSIIIAQLCDIERQGEIILRNELTTMLLHISYGLVLIVRLLFGAE